MGQLDNEVRPGEADMTNRSPGHGPILIFAPHPDDETLGCAGVIMKARRAGRSVRVVVCTNGDGFAKAAAVLSGKEMAALGPEDFLAVARVRQQGAIDATKVLGLASEDLVFLGYPDGGLDKMHADDGKPFTQPSTGRSCTYSLVGPDYHTQVHGEPAPYTGFAAFGDVLELINSTQPGEIYVTDAADGHGDHREWCRLVRGAAAAAGFGGEFFTYLIHSADGSWPTPRGANPDAPFEAKVVDGKQVPAGVAWPPPDRRPMSREEADLKLRAIRCYGLEMQLAQGYIESFVKSEEVFWRPG
jgi:LmbE family N-acetylglucosaminyl deacetylase